MTSSLPPSQLLPLTLILPLSSISSSSSYSQSQSWAPVDFWVSRRLSLSSLVTREWVSSYLFNPILFIPHPAFRITVSETSAIAHTSAQSHRKHALLLPSTHVVSCTPTLLHSPTHMISTLPLHTTPITRHSVRYDYNPLPLLAQYSVYILPATA